MTKTWITAHSGCEDTAENSMDSIRTGISLGADCVDVDVRLAPDGTLVLSHDMCEECANLVTLEQAFEAVAAAPVSINCDLKEYAALEAVLALAEKCGIGREKLIFSGSVDVRRLMEDPSVVRRSRVFLNSEELCRYMMDGNPGSREEQVEFFMENMAQIAAFMRRLGVEALNAPYWYLNDESIAALRGLGVELSLWTVNDPEDMRWLLKRDILNVTTRNVRVAAELRTVEEN